MLKTKTNTTQNTLVFFKKLIPFFSSKIANKCQFKVALGVSCRNFKNQILDRALNDLRVFRSEVQSRKLPSQEKLQNLILKLDYLISEKSRGSRTTQDNQKGGTENILDYYGRVYKQW